MKLYIGNKNYSSWSMRPWVLMREFDIAFDEVMIRFDDTFAPDSSFKREIAAISPAGRVPVLVLDGGHGRIGLAVWDTLAIAETLAERFPDKALWPRDAYERARARSICAEMHSGFGALRGTFPQNLEASLPHVGTEQLAKNPAAAADLARIDAMWADALARSGGPFLFGAYSIADAMYAPVAGRIRTYGLPVGEAARAYIDRLWATRGVAAWVREALAEATYLDFEEPYRKSR
jgi:glutathione S-transferase